MNFYKHTYLYIHIYICILQGLVFGNVKISVLQDISEKF
jgi:hypothetical protein